MPIGSYAAIPLLAQTLLQRKPRSVLDLGLGFGGGGVAVREWLDLGIRPWRTHLVGVECWAAYRNPVWDLYDIVYVRTIEEYLATSSERFDCVMLSDVLEHFDHEPGSALLKSLRRLVQPGGTLVVVTPATFFTQDAVYGNEHERHRSYWSRAELEQLEFQVEKAGHPDYFCGECWFATWRA